jgi:hypothetical protein
LLRERTDTQRILVLICVVSALAASAIAAVAWAHARLTLSLSCSGEPAQGANLLHATAIAFFGGIAASILIAVARRRRATLVAAVLVAAGLLGVALVFVSLDSATYVQLDRRCTDFGFGPLRSSTGHFGYLYAVWGGLIAVLLIEAALVLLGRPSLKRSNRAVTDGE